MSKIIAFDEVRSKEPADDFVRDVLDGCLGARAVIVGADFHFGKGRGGNVALLMFARAFSQSAAVAALSEPAVQSAASWAEFRDSRASRAAVKSLCASW